MMPRKWGLLPVRGVIRYKNALTEEAAGAFFVWGPC